MSREAEVTGSTLVTALCRGVVDYAGTFPPAELGLDDAVENYARYRRSADRWMLHRFVVSAGDLDTFAPNPVDPPWPVSVACRGPEDVARARAWQREAAVVASVEVRSTSPINAPGCEVFVECPLPIEPAELEELKARGAMLKIRLGGVSIPPSAAVARTLFACAAIDLPFKATAGLHHAIRSESHGFLNLLLATTLAGDGGDPDELEALLDETDAAAFTVVDAHITWRRCRFDAHAIAAARRLFRSFGSCSFEEPVDSIHALELPAR